MVGVALAHGGILGHELLNWDDPECIVDNRAVTEPDWGAIWSGHTPQAYPLTFSLFALEWQLWGAAPFGYHAVSLALHLANVALLLSLLRAAGMGSAPALLGALFFGLHPIQVATVAWASEQKTLLAGLLALGSWRVLWTAPRSARAGATALALQALALLAKTQVVLWPLGAMFGLRATPEEGIDGSDAGVRANGAGQLHRRRPLAIYLLGAVLLGAIAASVTAQRERVPSFEGNLGALERLWVVGRSFVFSVQKTLWPADLSALYPRWTVDPTALSAWIPSLSGLGLLALAVFVALRHRWLRVPVAAFVLPWIPASGLVPFGYQEKSFVADHLLYLSLVGPSFAVAALVQRFERSGSTVSNPRVGASLPIVVGMGLAILGLLTALRVPSYRDSVTFWEEVLRGNPTAWVAENNLGAAELGRGRLEVARRHLEAAVRLRPAYLEARLNLADVLVHSGEEAAAADQLRAALRSKPGDAGARARLAALGDTTSAATDLRVRRLGARVAASPGAFSPRFELARAQLESGELPEATETLRTALALAAGRADSLAAWTALGFAHTASLRLAEATSDYEAALRLAPLDPIAHMNLGVLLRAQGRFEEATARLLDAQRLAPDDEKIAANLEKARRRVR